MSEHFQHLYEQNNDPWQVRQRWYEQRKRALLLASLPSPHYHHAFEPACGNGELTAALARRADCVTASDLSPAAVELTRNRVAGLPAGRVSVACQRVPQDWPVGAAFDLIVISEMAYYLDADELEQLRANCVNSLGLSGALVLCHWRRPIGDGRQDADAIHAAFDAIPQLHRVSRHEEADFLLDVWSPDPRSVAQQEGVTA